MSPEDDHLRNENPTLLVGWTYHSSRKSSNVHKVVMSTPEPDKRLLIFPS